MGTPERRYEPNMANEDRTRNASVKIYSYAKNK
jgi:hypothetical protein